MPLGSKYASSALHQLYIKPEQGRASSKNRWKLKEFPVAHVRNSALKSAHTVRNRRNANSTPPSPKDFSCTTGTYTIWAPRGSGIQHRTPAPTRHDHGEDQGSQKTEKKPAPQTSPTPVGSSAVARPSPLKLTETGTSLPSSTPPELEVSR